MVGGKLGGGTLRFKNGGGIFDISPAEDTTTVDAGAMVEYLKNLFPKSLLKKTFKSFQHYPLTMSDAGGGT